MEILHTFTWPQELASSPYLALIYGHPRFVVQALLRDLLLPVLWLDGLFGSDFEWRGNAMSVAVDSEAVEAVDSGTA